MESEMSLSCRCGGLRSERPDRTIEAGVRSIIYRVSSAEREDVMEMMRVVEGSFKRSVVLTTDMEGSSKRSVVSEA